MKKDTLLALFCLAGIQVESEWELPNKYWPHHPDYAEVRAASPWWLVKTPYGLIEIGWRKRVISISWPDTKIAAEVTKDDVTKDEHLVHAWSYIKALEYLTELGRKLKASQPVAEAT